MENFMCKAYHVYQSGNICETPLLEAETKEELRVKLENYYNDKVLIYLFTPSRMVH